VFAFLADLSNHWRLSRRFAALESVDADGAGGRVRIRAPLGLSRVARTRVLEAEAPRRLRGRAELGRRTVGRVAWEIEPNGGGSRVTLSAEVVDAGAADRLLLALGGRALLARIFAEALDRLAAAA
jgi:hypothetical protein